MEIHGGPANRKTRKPVDSEWLKFMSDDDKEQSRIASWLNVSLAEANLPVRIINALENYGILTIGQLAEQTQEDLEVIPNLGAETIFKCMRLLEELKLPNKLGKGVNENK